MLKSRLETPQLPGILRPSKLTASPMPCPNLWLLGSDLSETASETDAALHAMLAGIHGAETRLCP